MGEGKGAGNPLLTSPSRCLFLYLDYPCYIVTWQTKSAVHGNLVQKVHIFNNDNKYNFFPWNFHYCISVSPFYGHCSLTVHSYCLSWIHGYVLAVQYSYILYKYNKKIQHFCFQSDSYTYLLGFHKKYVSFLPAPTFYWVPNKPEFVVQVSICHLFRYTSPTHTKDGIPVVPACWFCSTNMFLSMKKKKML